MVVICICSGGDETRLTALRVFNKQQPAIQAALYEYDHLSKVCVAKAHPGCGRGDRVKPSDSDLIVYRLWK